MNNITENFLELIDIEDIIYTNRYVNMVDISVDEDESFLLSNGIISHNSAENGARKHRDPQTQGMFKLKGKFLNTRKMSDKKIVENKEALNLMSAIGLTLNEKFDPEDLRFDEIIITCDSDCVEENTLVNTINGNIKIKDIKLGDQVLTHNNVYKKVINIIEQEKTSYIKVKINNEEVLFSENHKLIVDRDGEIIEILAKDLKYSDNLLMKQ